MTSLVSNLSLGMILVLVVATFAVPSMNTMVPLSFCFVMISLLAGMIAKQSQAITRLEQKIENGSEV